MVAAALILTITSCSASSTPKEAPAATDKITDQLGPDGRLPKPVTVTFSAPAKVLGLLLGPMESTWKEFEKRNIKLELVSASTSDATVLLATGKIDAMYGGASVGLFNAISGGADVRLVATGAIPTEDSGTGIYVSNKLLDGKPFSPKMLVGQKFASSQGSTGVAMAELSNIMEKGGLKASDVDVFSMATADQATAFQNGSIAAGTLSEPLNIPLEKDGLVTKISGNSPAGWSPSNIAFGPNLLRDHPEVGFAFVAAVRATHIQHLQGDFLADPKTAGEIAKALELPLNLVTEATTDKYQTTLKFPDDFVSQLDHAWREFPDQLQSSKPFTQKDVIDTRFMDYANSLDLG